MNELVFYATLIILSILSLTFLAGFIAGWIGACRHIIKSLEQEQNAVAENIRKELEKGEEWRQGGSKQPETQDEKWLREQLGE